MLRESLVSTLACDRAFELFSCMGDTELSADVAAHRPHVLIAGSLDPAVLYDAPRLRIYLLGSDAQSVRLVELRPVSEDIGSLSLSELVSAIKCHRGLHGALSCGSWH